MLKLENGIFNPSISTKVKVLLGYIPNYSNAKSLACDTGDEHALTCTRETCSCSQKLSNGTKGYDFYTYVYQW